MTCLPLKENVMDVGFINPKKQQNYTPKSSSKHIVIAQNDSPLSPKSPEGTFKKKKATVLEEEIDQYFDQIKEESISMSDI